MSVGIFAFRKTKPPSGRRLLPFAPIAPLVFLLIETTSKVSAVVDGVACVNTVALAAAEMITTSVATRTRAFFTASLVERRSFLQLRVSDDVVLDPELRTGLLQKR